MIQSLNTHQNLKYTLSRCADLGCDIFILIFPVSTTLQCGAWFACCLGSPISISVLFFFYFPCTVYLHTDVGSVPPISFWGEENMGWVGVRLKSHLCLFPALWQANVHPDVWIVCDGYLIVSGYLYSPHGICSVAARTRVLIMRPFGSSTRGQRRPSRSQRPSDWKPRLKWEGKKLHITLFSSCRHLKWPRKRSWKWMPWHQSCQSCYKAKFDCQVRCLSAAEAGNINRRFLILTD